MCYFLKLPTEGVVLGSQTIEPQQLYAPCFLSLLGLLYCTFLSHVVETELEISLWVDKHKTESTGGAVGSSTCANVWAAAYWFIRSVSETKDKITTENVNENSSHSVIEHYTPALQRAQKEPDEDFECLDNVQVTQLNHA